MNINSYQPCNLWNTNQNSTNQYTMCLSENTNLLKRYNIVLASFKHLKSLMLSRIRNHLSKTESQPCSYNLNSTWRTTSIILYIKVRKSHNHLWITSRIYIQSTKNLPLNSIQKNITTRNYSSIPVEDIKLKKWSKPSWILLNPLLHSPTIRTRFI